jgi:hypothetical protein
MQKRKAILLEKGKDNLKTNIGEGQRLSIVDKGKQHNTQQELAKELGWSTGKVAMADAIDEALESGEATRGHWQSGGTKYYRIYWLHPPRACVRG